MKGLFDITGKVVLVTGGSRGIGRMIAEGFVTNGATVYVSSRKAEACERTAHELSRFGNCLPLPADVTREEAWRDVADALQAREGRLDVLVNNAGASWGTPLDDYPVHGWDKVMDINLRGVFFLTQKLLPLLRQSAFAPARIINLASIRGLLPPEEEAYAYSASKAGCIMLTRHLAKRLARENILVNAIAPGPFATDMMAHVLEQRAEAYIVGNPLGRLGEASDIAGVALFLASRASAYTTGAVIPCDGGVAEV